jgi:hypothetical protein
MVTAEAAFAIGTLCLVAAVLAAGIGLLGVQLWCADAAREAARRLARGDTVGQVRAPALRDAPGPARLITRREGGLVTVTVTIPATAVVPAPLAPLLPDVALVGTATTLDEATVRRAAS